MGKLIFLLYPSEFIRRYYILILRHITSAIQKISADKLNETKN
jgi:hypothetical protein